MADHSTTTRNVQRDRSGVLRATLQIWWSSFLGGACCLSCLSRSCFGVDAQQLAAADPDSIVRRSQWISGAKGNEEPHPQVLRRKFLDEEERRSICRHKHSFTSLISVCRDDGVCCVFTLLLNLALFNLTVVINKRALNIFPYSSTLESLLHLRVWRVCTLVFLHW